MKRQIILVMVILLSFTACSTTKKLMYTVQSGASESTDYEDEQESPLETLCIGEKSFEVRHTEKTDWKFRPDWERYVSEDETIEISMIENEGGFLVSNRKGALEEFPEDTVTEGSLLQFVKTVITQYAGEVDFSRYTYSIYSFFSCSGENSTWNEKREGFYPYDSENENEHVQWYSIVFDEYCNDIKTINGIYLRIDNYGNIETIRYYNYDADWNSFVIDEEGVVAAVEYYVDDYVRKNDYKKVSYEIRSQTLGWSGEEIYLEIEMSIRFLIDYGEGNGGKYFSGTGKSEFRTLQGIVLTQ